MINKEPKQYNLSTDFLKLSVLDYGTIINNLILNDKYGNPVNVIINMPEPLDYLNNPVYLGATVGRYAGRIKNGTFYLNNQQISLDAEKGVHLHGGVNGWSMKYWTVEAYNNQVDAPFIKLRYNCKHTDKGYPGNITVYTTYTLLDNSLDIKYEATSDRDTILNITNHSYFNLSGKGNSIDKQSLKINADSYLEVNEKLIPTGKILSLKDTEMDFSIQRKIEATRVDDTYILTKDSENDIVIKAPDTGIAMKVSTNQPAAVVFTPEDFPAICFETQNYPDAPNHKNFPSALLKANELYLNHSVFSFAVEPNNNSNNNAY